MIVEMKNKFVVTKKLMEIEKSFEDRKNLWNQEKSCRNKKKDVEKTQNKLRSKKVRGIKK